MILLFAIIYRIPIHLELRQAEQFNSIPAILRYSFFFWQISGIDSSSPVKELNKTLN